MAGYVGIPSALMEIYQLLLFYLDDDDIIYF